MYITEENPKEYTAKNVHNLLVSIAQENALDMIYYRPTSTHYHSHLVLILHPSFQKPKAQLPIFLQVLSHLFPCNLYVKIYNITMQAEKNHNKYPSMDWNKQS